MKRALPVLGALFGLILGWGLKGDDITGFSLIFQNAGTPIGAAPILNAGAGLSAIRSGGIVTMASAAGAVPASATLLGSNASSQFISQTATVATAFLNTFTSLLQGLAPASGGGTTNFLRADGSWASPPGTGINQLTGDVQAGPGTGSVAANVSAINGTTFTGTTPDAVIFCSGSITPCDSKYPIIATNCGVTSTSAVGICNGTLTQSNITGMNGTPVALIATPGSGAMTVIDACVLEFVPGGTAYASGGSVEIGYNGISTSACAVVASGSGGTANLFTAAQIQGATTLVVRASGFGIGTAGTSTNYVNQPVDVSNITTAFTCSGTCGTINYWIRYHIMSGF